MKAYKSEFKFSHIIFNEGPDRWMMHDPTCEKLHEAAHKARYAKQHLTQDDCYLLAGVVRDYCYLATGAGWGSKSTSVGKIRDIIEALNQRELK